MSNQNISNMLIFDKSTEGRSTKLQAPDITNLLIDIPQHCLRRSVAKLPEVAELDVIRHYTNLSQRNFAIDTNFYPLGSCTMKYNPRGAHQLASLPGFLQRHPAADLSLSQGIMSCLFELQDMLKDITGMHQVALSPLAGAQGEFAGVAMIRAYHQQRGDYQRDEIIVPDSAHGTNPASAAMCGFKVREIPTAADGDLDFAKLKAAISERTAGIMLTNPSTLGLFERQIKPIAALIHQAGGLLYYDGANLNAILGLVRPGDMGFDVIHLNLHKTFATPHGGGGPGCGPIAVSERLAPFLPMPIVGKIDKFTDKSKSKFKSESEFKSVQYTWLTQQDYPHSIGSVATFAGNVGIMLRAYIYIRMLGREGLRRVANMAVLNANYLLRKLQDLGFQAAYPKRRAMHEFVITFKREAKQNNLTALNFAKRLLDLGVHAPTMYFPLLVPECWLIEPTETESKATLDHFINIMAQLADEAKTAPEKIRNAPLTLPISRLDEALAAKNLDIVF